MKTWQNKPIEEIDLGHLTNSIRVMGEKLERMRALGDKRGIEHTERALIGLQAELDRRGPEIEQVQGIFRALTKKR